MDRHRHWIVTAAFAALLALPLTACAQDVPAAPGSEVAAPGNAADQPAVSLTIYSSADPAAFDPQAYIAQRQANHYNAYYWRYQNPVPGFGVVREIRAVDLQQGVGSVAFTDVAEFIDPTTVSFTDLTDPDGTEVLEQRFLFDLVSPRKLIEKYIDQQITVLANRGEGRMETITGKLLATQANMVVLQTDAGVRIMPQHEVQLPELTGDLITKPTLQWKLAANEGGRHTVRTAYQTDGLTWRSDYNLVLNETDTQADIGAWVTILNLSGKAYKETKLKLIAGDVQRIDPNSRRQYAQRAGYAMDMAEKTAGFEEKTFFEYHMYTLPRLTDVDQNTTQQITLFPTAADVGVEKVLVYYGLPVGQSYRFTPNPITDRDLGSQSNKKVDIYVRFENSEDNRMGMPLPRGKVRVFKKDPADGTLEFVGEDLIDHTPRDEQVLIKIGQAFDIVGERTQTDYKVSTNQGWIEETIEIELRNHKDKAEKVIVKENLYRWLNWKLIKHSDEFEKVDSRTVHFNVDVPARGSKTVTYTVKYTWRDPRE